MDAPLARRLERPMWINLRTVLGVVLFGVALLAGQQILASGTATTAVWQAARDLAGGATLGPGDVEVAQVRLPEDLVGEYVASGNDLAGLVLTRAITSGELIPASSVANAAAADQVAMTIPVAPEHALGGALRPGDQVDVYVTYNAGDLRAVTRLVLDNAEILDLVTAGGLVVGEKAVIGVTVSVEDNVAKELAFALRNGEIDLARGTSQGDPP